MPVLSALSLPTTRFRYRLFSAVLLILLSTLLFFELNAKEQLPQIETTFRQQWGKANFIWLLLAVLLMPFNWLAETAKWKQLVQQYEPMGWWKALQAVWIGLAVSLFMPNRTGEFAGRILFVRPENRSLATVANFIGNFAQLTVTGCAGIAGAWWLFTRWWHPDSAGMPILLLAAILACCALLFLYTRVRHLPILLANIPIPLIKRFAKDRFLFDPYRPSELYRILAWAILRYLLFASQYFFLLNFFGIKPGIMNAFAGISVLFLVQTGVPLPPLAGLLARGNVAILIWGQTGAPEVCSLAATFALWIINLILPALVGTFSLFFVNIAKT
ncbi:MAG: lysylphosphatidylglycerol synthase transmembrane domain-containing protein [Saprospiraceae bacterium]|nr:lysylphosphatidylglycerol synthase transmembrane domain-containing protein [Saprospiraceae bacterium]